MMPIKKQKLKKPMFSVNSKQIKMPSPYVLPNLWKNNFWYIIFGIAIVYFPYHFLIGSVLLKDISSSIMSGQQQVKHVHSTDQTSVIVDDQDNGKYNEEEKSNRLETAVIILSSLIPSHPSLWMLEKVIKSLENLDGLHPNAPIYITVDAPKKDKLVEKAEELDEYTRALYRRFRDDENRHVTIVVNSVNRHVNGSIRKVVFDLINTNVTKYIYLLQHDLMFMPGKIINHTALVGAFDKYYNTDELLLVGFNKDGNQKHLQKGHCQERTDRGMKNPLEIYSGEPNKTEPIYVTHTKGWSDQNHFTTVQYYRELVETIGPVPRFPEGPLQYAAVRNCLMFGSHFYGSKNDGNYICHLDGSEHNYKRGTCGKEFRDGNQ